jgi:hypothetical protein
MGTAGTVDDGVRGLVVHEVRPSHLGGEKPVGHAFVIALAEVARCRVGRTPFQTTTRLERVAIQPEVSQLRFWN